MEEAEERCGVMGERGRVLSCGWGVGGIVEVVVGGGGGGGGGLPGEGAIGSRYWFSPP